MHIPELRNIVIIGAGNVATNLALALKDKGEKIIQVYSRTEKSAKTLADIISSSYTDDLKKINMNSDLYIISVPDSAIIPVLKHLSLKNKFIVHTCGSMDMDILKHASSNYGVFYPLQTFSRNRKADFTETPVCIEANNIAYQEALMNLAKLLSDKVYIINSGKRKILHLAAVFACNFPNYMYRIAEKITENNDIPFDILRPLIKETTGKIMTNSPSGVQTGPASRKDTDTIEKHIDMLSEYPDFKQIYELITRNILNDK